MSRPRIRYIKPEIWLSRDFRALTPIGRLTFMALISNADDDGRLKTDPGHLALTYLPGCEPYEIATQLEAMEERRMVMTYVVRGVHYLAVTGWSTHQRVSHYVKSDLPEPPKFKRRPDNGAQLVLKTSSTGSQNKETGTANKRQSELDSLRSGTEDVSSPARPRSSANGLVPSSSTVSSPTTGQELALLSRPTRPIDEGAAQLVEVFTDSLIEWNAKRASSPAKDLEAARRLLRIDNRPLDEALAVLSWATHDDSFWRPLILSLSKFREKYDTLRGQMQRGGRREHPADTRVRQLGEMALKFEAEDQ